jgi:hypothetical protein
VIVKPFVQLVFLVGAFMVAISRVNDFKHFPSDVIAGGLLGVSVALFVYNVLDLADLSTAYFWTDCSTSSSDHIDHRKGEKAERGSRGGLLAAAQKPDYKTFDDPDSLRDDGNAYP